MNAAALITLLLGLLDRAGQIGALLHLVQSENRDVTAAELDALAQADEIARQALVDAILAARAGA